MQTPAIVTVGAVLLSALGWLVLHVVSDLTANEAKEAVLRRPSFAVRRSRHRGLMKSGYACAVLAFLAGFLGLAAATSGFEDDATDARLFTALAVGLAVLAVGLLATWWRRSGRPFHG